MSRSTRSGQKSISGCAQVAAALTDTFHYERSLIRAGYPSVAGVDEAGRGPLAGPVVAGCVILPDYAEYFRFKDSKVLTPERREALYDYLRECGAGIGFGVVSPAEIDRINILQASLQAMARAVSQLTGHERQPDYLLVDGKFVAPVDLPQQPLVKGESKSASIAAASIVAKVERDRLMADYHREYPEYNFARNKGYATKDHRQAIARHGPCPIHRRTFKGVREFLDESSAIPSISQQPLW
ncbi:MAG: ribonuclease HII [Desulfobulbaceae bacterium]|nr:ribonuclease HII [Desulfobulbaceae bacterium]